MLTPEREPQVSEKVNIHERGGLTPTHWQEVVKRIAQGQWRLGETSAKIVAYAQKVISGEFPDSGFYHRRFLGHRHWRYIAILDTRYKVKTPRRFPPWPKTTWIKNDLPQEIREFARSEQRKTYTLNDYIDDLPEKVSVDSKRSSEYEESRDFVWDLKKGRWETRIYSARLARSYNEYDETSITFEDSVDINLLLSYFLLTKEEVPNPKHTSPEDMKQILKNAFRSNPVKIQNSLREISQTFRGKVPEYVEEEIE